MNKVIFSSVNSVIDKEKLMMSIYPLLEITYKNTLGVGISPDNLVQTDGMYSLASIDNKIVAGVIYKNFHGNKIRLVFHSGTISSKKIMMKILTNDLKSNNVWVECSGPMEKLMNSIKAPYINADTSKLLLPTEIMNCSDNIHYNREVRPGIFKIECCMGNPIF